jgi:hypothetical protein
LTTAQLNYRWVVELRRLVHIVFAQYQKTQKQKKAEGTQLQESSSAAWRDFCEKMVQCYELRVKQAQPQELSYECGRRDAWLHMRDLFAPKT